VPTSSTAPAMSWPCVIDRTRPCGLCAAPTQALCPYPYLLDHDEPAEPVEPGPTDRTSRESEAVQVPTAGPSSLT
jgi:hypothetical protein